MYSDFLTIIQTLVAQKEKSTAAHTVDKLSINEETERFKKGTGEIVSFSLKSITYFNYSGKAGVMMCTHRRDRDPPEFP